MIPRMVERGYPRGQATGLIACSSVLGQLIPPSVPMILYAWVTWQSVAACFLATVVPGIILVIIYSVINWFMCQKLPIKVSPPISGGEQVKEFGRASYKGFFCTINAHYCFRWNLWWCIYTYRISRSSYTLLYFL